MDLLNILDAIYGFNDFASQDIPIKILVFDALQLTLCLFNLIARHRRPVVFTPKKAYSTVKISQIMMFPLKIISVVLTAYLGLGGSLSIMGLFYLISLMGMMVYFMREGSKTNKIKINLTGYINALSYLTGAFLTIFAIVLVTTKFLLKNETLKKKLNLISKVQLQKFLVICFVSEKQMFKPICLYIALATYLYFKKLIKILRKFLGVEDRERQQKLDKKEANNYIRDEYEIPKDSLFIQFFVENVFQIFQINKVTSINKKNKFERKFLQNLYDQNCEVREKLKITIEENQKYKAQWKQLKDSVGGYLTSWFAYTFRVLVDRINFCNFLVINILTFFYLGEVRRDNIFQLCLVLWLLINFVITSKPIIINTGVFLVMPSYIIHVVYHGTYDLIIFFRKETFTNEKGINYYEFTIFIMVLIYIFLLIMSNRSKKLRSNLKRFLMKKINNVQDAEENQKGSHQEKFFAVLTLMVKQLMSVFRYLPLFVSVIVSLFTINVVNALLLTLSLFFLWKKSIDKKYWIYFLYYNIFFIPLLYTAILLQSGIYSFNQELLSILGVFASESPFFYRRVQLHFLTAFLASIHYKLVLELIDMPQSEKIKKIIVKNKAIAFFSIFNDISSRLYNSYMIWVFHVFLILLLLLEGKYDFVALAVLFAEFFILPIHLYTWKRASNTMNIYKRLFSSWKFLYFLINIFVFWRYFLFMARYTYFKDLLKKLFKVLYLEKRSKFILTDIDKTAIDNLFKDFVFELIILGLNFLTLMSFEKTRSNKKIVRAYKYLTYTIQGTFITGKYKRFVFGKRAISTFLMFYLSLKGFLFYLFAKLLYLHLSPIKIFLLLVPLIYFNLLARDFDSVLKKFKLREILPKWIEYFKVRYVKDVKSTKLNKGFNCGVNDRMDHEHNLTYLAQLLKQIENRVLKLSLKFWPWFCYPLMLYLAIISLIHGNLQLNLVPLDGNIAGYFMGFLFGHINRGTKDALDSELVAELLEIQKIIMFLIIEFVCLTYYTSLKENIKILPDDIVESLCLLLLNKIKLYTCRRNASELVELFRIYYLDILEIYNKQLEEYFTEDFKKNRVSRERPTNFSSRTRNTEIELTNFNKTTKLPGNHLLAVEKPEPEKLGQDLTSTANQNSAIEDKTRSPSLLPPPLVKTFSTRPIYEYLVQSEDLQCDVFDITKSKLLFAENIYQETKRLKKKGSHIKSKPSIIYMFESAGIRRRILFYHKNKQKYSLAVVYCGVSHLIRRLALIPLLLSINFNKNLINVLFIIVTIGFSLQPRESFEISVRKYLPMITVLIFFQYVIDFAVWNFGDHPVLREHFIGKMLLLVSTKSSVGEAAIRSMFISCIGLGFASIVFAAKFVFGLLFRQIVSTENSFFEYKADANQLHIDFKEWKISNLRIFGELLKFVVLNTQEVYLTGLIVFTVANPKASYLGLLMFIVFALNTFAKIKKVRSERGYQAKKATKIFRIVVVLLVYGVFLKQILIQLIATFSQLQRGKLAFLVHVSNLNNGSVPILLLSFLAIDVISMKDYSKDMKVYKVQANIKNKLSTLCLLYEKTDDKLFKRVNLMTTNDSLQENVKLYLDSDLNSNQKKTTDYRRENVKDALEADRYQFFEPFFPRWKLMWMKGVEKFYNMLETRTNSYRHQDPLYLISYLVKKNRKIINLENIMIEDYFTTSFSFCEEILDEILLFYQHLNKGFKQPMAVYQRAIKKYEGEVFKKIKRKSIFYNQHQKLLGRKSTFLEKSSKNEERKRSSTGFKLEVNQRKSVNVQNLEPPQDKKKENLVLCSNLLLKKIENKNKLLQEKDQYFKEDEGLVQFKLENGTKLVIHNISRTYLFQTFGYVRFKFYTMLKVILRWGTSNVDKIVIYIIIFFQVFFGGFNGFLIITVILFVVLIEEYGCHVIWWEIINILAFVQLTFKILFKNSPNSSYTPWVNFFFGSTNYTCDAVLQILIMWVISILDKQGRGINDRYLYDNPSFAAARVNFFIILAYYKRDN